MGTIISLFFSGLWQALLSKFGISTDRKLGRDEIIISEQNAIIQGVKDAENIQNNTASLSDADVNKQLRDK